MQVILQLLSVTSTAAEGLAGALSLIATSTQCTITINMLSRSYYSTVSAFLAQPLLGDAATRRRLRAAVAAVVTLRRRERLAVGQLLPGVAVSSLPWAPASRPGAPGLAPSCPVVTHDTCYDGENHPAL